MRFILSVCFFLISLTSQAAQKELKIGISQEFDSLHQSVSGMLASHYIFYSVGRPLIVLDANGQWQPSLAVKVPSLKNKDARYVQTSRGQQVQADWIIKSNAKWSDGTPVTCADFQLALDVAKTETVSIANRENYILVEKIEWDEKTPQKCLFKYTPNRWDYTQIGRFIPLPNHLERPIYEKYKAQKEGYEKNSLYQTAPTTPGLYNGPYQVVDYKPGSHVVVSPNSHFYGSAPQFEKVIFRIIPNTGTLEANLQSGEIDIITQFGYSIEQALDFEKRILSGKKPLKIYYTSSLSVEHIDLDLNHPALKDKKVRQALLFGLNRKELTQTLFEGKQNVADQFFHPVDPWYTRSKKIRQYDYDFKKAQQLLDQAGWKLNPQDNLRYKKDQKLSLRLMTTAGNKSREVVQTYIQNEWKKLGVEVLIKNEPARVFFGETLKKRLFSGAALFAWTVLPEKSPKAFLHSSGIPSEANNWSGRNYNSWSHKRADQLMDKMESSFDSQERKRAAQQFSELYTEELPALPLYYKTEIVIAPQNLKGLQPTGHLFTETLSIENWKME
jgi:peptide/nickel transport system substrate-binding protein